jgi:hypothetical protein
MGGKTRHSWGGNTVAMKETPVLDHDFRATEGADRPAVSGGTLSTDALRTGAVILLVRLSMTPSRFFPEKKRII